LESIFYVKNKNENEENSGKNYNILSKMKDTYAICVIGGCFFEHIASLFEAVVVAYETPN